MKWGYPVLHGKKSFESQNKNGVTCACPFKGMVLTYADQNKILSSIIDTTVKMEAEARKF